MGGLEDIELWTFYDGAPRRLTMQGMVSTVDLMSVD
jgi:hypothetical protein